MTRAASILCLASLACGPVQSSTLIVDAQAELSAAKTADADKHSPFEYHAAEEYLHKAREEQSYSEFEVAVRFAKKSRDCAKLARARAEQATRQEMGAEGEARGAKVRCRPGPERPNLQDPSEMPAAKLEPAEPQDPPARAGEPKDPPPEEPRKSEPKKAEPKKAEPKGDKAPVKPIKPAEEPLPEGDQEEKP